MFVYDLYYNDFENSCNIEKAPVDDGLKEFPFIDVTNVPRTNVMTWINSDAFWNECEVKKSIADGHCILHSILTSLSNQNVPISMDEIIHKIYIL